MPRMSQQEYAAYQAKHEPKQTSLLPTSDDLESELHEQIESWCRRQDPQVPYGHARMDRKSTYTPGFPDFVLFLPGPGRKTLLIECKAGDNDLSEDQAKFKAACEAVGHPVFIVRTYDQFLGIVNETMKI